ncbi:MAG: response regulator transcription factor [Chitinophagaceae bacterium]
MYSNKAMNIQEPINIAIVDDHFLYKKGLKLAFSYYKDINVLFDAENGLHLLSQLEKVEPHVILLDLQMSVMDGIAALHEIKKNYPRIKVIILSMNGEDSMVAKLRNLGADSYLTKNSDPRQMYKEIRDVMNSTAHFAE